ncbi:hypothetical protein JCM3775_001792 [Rhodotorula graminis]
MASDTYPHTFTWCVPPSRPLVRRAGAALSLPPAPSTTVWSSSLPPLNKQPDGTFAGQIGVPFGNKILYKFVVDGQWVNSPDDPTETDGSGNVNNVFQVPDKTAIVAQATPTDAALPVPESSSTVAGNVSALPATSVAAGSTNTSPAPGVAAQVQAKAAEAATTAQDVASQAQQKAVEVAPVVKDQAVDLANKASETVKPAAVAIGGAAVAAAGAAAAGIAALASSATETAKDAGNVAQEKAQDLSAKAPSSTAPPLNNIDGGPTLPAPTEKPVAPHDTPITTTTNSLAQQSVPTVPAASFVASHVSESAAPSTTEAAPKYDEHTAVVAKDDKAPLAGAPVAGASASTSSGVAPVYNEHTAVVAKEGTTPQGPSTPVAGSSAENYVSGGAAPQEDEHAPKVEGLVAPKEHPEDAPAIAAGIAAVGAAVAGLGVLGHKAYEVVHPHAQHAAAATNQSLQDAAHTADAYLTQARQGGEQRLHDAQKAAHDAAVHAQQQAQAAYEQAQAQAAHAREGVLGAVGYGKKKVDEATTPAPTSSTSTATPVAAGIPDKEISPLPASEAPVATGKPDPHPPVTKAVVPSAASSSTTTEAPNVPEKEITPLPASEAPVASADSNRVPTDLNAVVPKPSPMSSSSTSAPAQPASTVEAVARSPAAVAAPTSSASTSTPIVKAAAPSPPPAQPLPAAPAATSALAPPVAPIEPPSTAKSAVPVAPAAAPSADLVAAPSATTATTSKPTAAPSSTPIAAAHARSPTPPRATPAFAPSNPSTPQKPETFTTAPSTPANSVGRASGVQAQQASLGQGAAPSSPAVSETASSKDGKRRSFFSRVFSSKKDK